MPAAPQFCWGPQALETSPRPFRAFKNVFRAWKSSCFGSFWSSQRAVSEGMVDPQHRKTQAELELG